MTKTILLIQKLILILMVLWGGGKSFAQENIYPDSKEYQYAISVKNTLLWSNGISFSARILPHYDLETTLSLGLAMGGEAGINYFLFSEEKKYNPYTGLHAGWMTMHFLSRSDYWGIMVPLGMQFYRSKWLFGIETGYIFLHESSYQQGAYSPYRYENYHLPYYSVKIGFRFPKKK